MIAINFCFTNSVVKRMKKKDKIDKNKRRALGEIDPNMPVNVGNEEPVNVAVENHPNKQATLNGFSVFVKTRYTEVKQNPAVLYLHKKIKGFFFS